MGVAERASSGRSQSIWFPFVSTPTKTSRRPFGEMANRPTPPSVLPAGN